MKKLIITVICCGFAFGCASNSKVLDNTTAILKGENIKIAEHIYGNPSDIQPAAKIGEKIYIWSVNTSNIIGETSQEDTILSGEKETKVNKTLFLFSRLCYIALKTNINGIIIDGFHSGFDGYGCHSLYGRSLTFCQEVDKETRKVYKKGIGLCNVNDFEKIKTKRPFAIPSSYVDNYYYEEDRFFNN